MKKATAGKAFPKEMPKAAKMTSRASLAGKFRKPKTGKKSMSGVKVTGTTAVIEHPAQSAQAKAQFTNMKKVKGHK